MKTPCSSSCLRASAEEGVIFRFGVVERAEVRRQGGKVINKNVLGLVSVSVPTFCVFKLCKKKDFKCKTMEL